jgi:hypothetical protein
LVTGLLALSFLTSDNLSDAELLQQVHAASAPCEAATHLAAAAPQFQTAEAARRTCADSAAALDEIDIFIPEEENGERDQRRLAETCEKLAALRSQPAREAAEEQSFDRGCRGAFQTLYGRETFTREPGVFLRNYEAAVAPCDNAFETFWNLQAGAPSSEVAAAGRRARETCAYTAQRVKALVYRPKVAAVTERYKGVIAHCAGMYDLRNAHIAFLLGPKGRDPSEAQAWIERWNAGSARCRGPLDELGPAAPAPA